MPGKITVQAACLRVEARKKEEGLWCGGDGGGLL